MLVLTRPAEGAARFAAALDHNGPVIFSPALTIRPVVPGDNLTPDGVILTSGHGARFAGALGLGPLPAWCVGRRTTEVAQSHGFAAQFAGADADALVATLAATRPGGRIVHLRGARARGRIAARLTAVGLQVDETVIYRQEDADPKPALIAAAAGPQPLVFPLFSPASAAILTRLERQAPIHVIAMSDSVANRVAGLDCASVTVAAAPDLPAMVVATRAVLSRLTVT